VPLSGEPVAVLLVEDSPSDAALLRASLHGAGRFVVTCAESLAEAFALTRARPFDAVLLDLTLPDCTGLETVDRARAAWPALPVLVLTGADDEAVAVEAVQRGVQDYLVKGQTDERLVARALRYAIERQRAETEIRRVNAELEQRVIQRTAQLRRLASELTLAEQRERRRLGELLHDNLQQLLVFARLTVGGVRPRCADAGAQQALARVEDTLGEAVELARSLTADLSPPTLYEHGLAAAVRLFGRRLQEQCGLEVGVEADPEAEAASESVRVLLYQSIRELLTNVVKHAGVPRAEVRIARQDDGGLRIEVADAGTGFEPYRVVGAPATRGFGLFSIRERLQLLGGGLEVASAPGRGTRVTLTVPPPGETGDGGALVRNGGPSAPSAG
jgi:signal transduction histidine kinase